MREADDLLDDEDLLDTVYEAQGRRRKHSRTRGRKQTPAEVVLRMLILKHARNWSFETLEQEVRVNLVYREFTRIGIEKVPDAKVVAKIACVLGPTVVEELHRRIVELARDKKLIAGRKMRVDTTVRQQFARRRHAGSDAIDETGRGEGWRIDDSGPQSHAEHPEEGGFDCGQQSAEGIAR